MLFHMLPEDVLGGVLKLTTNFVIAWKVDKVGRLSQQMRADHNGLCPTE